MKIILCFSHLRWDFVYQRPQHLLSRFASQGKVLFFEEPITSLEDRYEFYSEKNVFVIKIFTDLESDNKNEKLKNLIDKVLEEFNIDNYSIWYYTPMALEYTVHLQPEVIIYDSMDELSAFRFADTKLIDFEHDLFEMADVVFTGGYSLYEAKKHRHENIHPFPSSIDKEHFVQAREQIQEPGDQQNIPYPRLGFFGVVDERFDIELLKNSALLRPEWQFVIIGPVVKIDPADLPQLPNIHYLGSKKYSELPAYISHWDISLILFARNKATEFISPTKTPEYLAAGLPVISTPIKDVINPYGDKKLVHIAETAEELVEAAERELSNDIPTEWLKNVDNFLEGHSWDITFEEMSELIEKAKRKKSQYV